MNVAVEDQVSNADNSLGNQFTMFEARSKAEFDANGWQAFTEKIIEYHNDLYTGSRRECIERMENSLKPLFSGKDVERASIRLDLQRLYTRRQRKNYLQLGALIASLLTGISANWAFTDISRPQPTILPWCTLILCVVVTLALYHFQTVGEIAS